MSHLIQVNGKIAAPHDGLDRGDRVRVVVEGVITSYEEKDTESKGTDFILKLSAKTGIVLNAGEAEQFDVAIAKAKADAREEATGEMPLDLDGDGDVPVNADDDEEGDDSE